MSNKRLAVGSADVTLSDALFVGIANSTDRGLVVKSASSQSANLTEWRTYSDAVVASVERSGVIVSYGLVASGAGLQLDNVTPNITSNTLYNVNGGLYFDGGLISVPTGVPSGIAFF